MKSLRPFYEYGLLVLFTIVMSTLVVLAASALHELFAD